MKKRLNSGLTAILGGALAVGAGGCGYAGSAISLAGRAAGMPEFGLVGGMISLAERIAETNQYDISESRSQLIQRIIRGTPDGTTAFLAFTQGNRFDGKNLTLKIHSEGFDSESVFYVQPNQEYLYATYRDVPNNAKFVLSENDKILIEWDASKFKKSLFFPNKYCFAFDLSNLPLTETKSE